MGVRSCYVCWPHFTGPLHDCRGSETGSGRAADLVGVHLVPCWTMTTLLNDAAARATRYLEELGDRRVAPSGEALETLRELEHPFPNEPIRPEAVLEILDRVGSPATVGMAGAWDT